MDYNKYWQEFERPSIKLIEYFNVDAIIYWPNTNEQFTVKEFVDVNISYPGKWCVEVEKIIDAINDTITITHVFNENISYHAISIFTITNNKIYKLEEYWTQDEDPPLWRSQMNIGKRIN